MLQFRIQSTPNPNARKYIVNHDLKAAGKVSYQEVDQCQHVSMAAQLLASPGVSQVHFFENVLTVTQDGSWDWGSLDKMVQQTVASLIDSHDPHFIDHPDKVREPRNLSPELEKIEEILDRTVRAALQADGGDIETVELVSNLLTVRYLGACGSCPSSMSATLDAIRSVLRDEYSEDLEIVAV